MKDHLLIQIKKCCVLILLCTIIFPLNTKGQNRTKVTYKVSNGVSKMSFSKRGNDFDIEYEGDIEVNNTDTDIIGISRGGYIEITKAAFGSKRRIIIESDRSGNLTKEYYSGRRQIDYEPEGKEWLAELLPDIVRKTTIAAESRVNRIYRNGGITALTKEISSLQGDYVKTAYFNIILEESLSESEVEQVVLSAGDEVNSDHYLTEILKNNHRKFTESNQLVNAYLQATSTVGSDHYKTEALKRLIQGSDITSERIQPLIDATRDINSDHYLSVIFKEILEEGSTNADLDLGPLIRGLNTMSSDHYQMVTLKRVIQMSSFNSQHAISVIQSMYAMGSDHYFSETAKLLLTKDLNEEAISRLLDAAAEEVSSDHYLSSLLRKLAVEKDLNDKSFDSLVRALKTLSSDHYFTEVMEEFSEQSGLTDSQLIDLLIVSESVSSDHYMTEILKSFAPSVNRAGIEVKETYKEVAKSISSETYFGRVMRLVD